jgi:hypothetical protein
MLINNAMNIVISLERDDGSTVYVHATPASPEMFKRYFMVLSKTFTSFMNERLGPVGGPRIGAMLLEQTAKETLRFRGDPPTSWWEGPDGVEAGLLGEMRRLASVIALHPERGWSPLPLDEALRLHQLTTEEADEVLNQLAFFTVCSLAPPKKDRRSWVEGGAAICGSQITSSNCMEFAASLPTSTEDETSGEAAKPLETDPKPDVPDHVRRSSVPL